MNSTVKPLHSIPQTTVRIALISGMLFLVLLAALLVLKPEIDPAWRPALPWMLGILGLMWTVYAWLILSMPADGNFGPDVQVGWPSRMLMVSYCIWLMVTGWQALRLRRQVI